MSIQNFKKAIPVDWQYKCRDERSIKTRVHFDKVKTMVQNIHIAGAELQNNSNKQLYDIFVCGKSEKMYIIKTWQDQYIILGIHPFLKTFSILIIMN